MNRAFLPRLVRGLAALLLLALPPLAAADGPYVRPDPHGGWVAQRLIDSPTGLQVRRESLAPGQELIVDAVGSVPSFRVQLRPPATTAPDALRVESDAPLFVVADIHGEYDILVELLRAQGIVDAALRWSYGRGHLVFLGDVFDRGAHQVAVLWLIYQLQTEAEAAGGSVEFLLGNHEVLALRGDARYLNARYGDEARALGAAAYADLFDAGSVLGQWLRTRASILQLGDVLLLHGGIAPEVLTRGLGTAQLSRAVREVLDGRADPEHSPLHAFAIRTPGPLWYRGYFSRDGAPAEASLAEVDALRRHFGVRAILVGHTALDAVTPLFDGRVIAVQIYPERDPETGGAVIGAVRRERGQWYSAGVDGRRAPLKLAPAPEGT